MHDIDRTQVGFGYEMENDPYGSRGSLQETDEMELAAGLMEVSSEEEFENFLGDLISRAVKAAGGFLGSPSGKALAGLLKGAAKQILPVVQQVAGAEGGEMEMEMEMEGNGSYLSEEEMEARDWEAAQTFVNLAQEAAAIAAQAPPDADPNATAQKAVADAAQVHAPALLAPPAPKPQPPFGGPSQAHPPCGCGKKHHAGRWIRRGNQIVVLGV